MVIWLEVPVEPAASRGSVRPKYSVGRAVVVLDNESAYVGLLERTAAAALLAHEDVRELSRGDMERIRPEIPLSWETLEQQVLQLSDPRPRPHALGLGDAIAALTRRARIRECGSCAQRRKGLNRIIIWGWWRRRRIQVQPEG
ncbi:hypothetical protein [Streptomyces tubercidicus]|uniref:hypothetical protein n=1 Tax=Streptomyces tubercidicus TaxID=47759 RepID=UPI0022B7C755|nr:hypothetical protein [Streptomyces tubercidicus]WAU10045.1 hypothetical protein STRTU_000094 [Streptomyces tubercidicus]